MVMNAVPDPYPFYEELKLALRPGWPQGEHDDVDKTILEKLTRSELWFRRERGSFYSNGPSRADFVKDIVLALYDISNIDALKIKRVFAVLREHKQYTILEELFGRLPGGPKLFILNGGDFGSDQQIDWRKNTLPGLYAITVEARVAKRIVEETTPGFMRSIGAVALSHNGDLTMKIYFEDEEQAVLQKMKL